MIRSFLAASLAATALIATPAFADDNDDRGAWRDARGGYSQGVTRAEAIDIARGYGLHRIEEVERDDGEWEIEGWTRNGREIEIEISARTGRVLEVEIDD
ncbi:MAG: PepSY domain-containing protein [Hyphomonadaceae bacterium]|nr:PepSY domain-containing protein [Hyphomonadaceae bacterium]